MNRKLQIRVRAIPARFVIDQSPQKVNKKSLFELLRDWLGLIATATGLFAVLFYLAGRSFAGGYFSAMNIPNYQVTFSLWEYEEAGWEPLLYYPLRMMILSGVLGGIIIVIWDWIKRVIRVKLPIINFSSISRDARWWFLLAGVSAYMWLVVFTFSLTLQSASQKGEETGRNYILHSSAEIEIISTNPIPLDSSFTAVQNPNGTYVYNGLHLLTYNNGKYYLFKEIDKATCKPSKVYIVNAGMNIQINLLPPVSLANQCSKTADNASSPTVQYP